MGVSHGLLTARLTPHGPTLASSSVLLASQTPLPKAYASRYCIVSLNGGIHKDQVQLNTLISTSAKWQKENPSTLQNVHGKFVEKVSDRISSQTNFQCRYFVAAVRSGPISLPWMRCRSQTGIIDDQPISFTIKRVNSKYLGDIFGTNCTLGPFASRYRLTAT